MSFSFFVAEEIRRMIDGKRIANAVGHCEIDGFANLAKVYVMSSPNFANCERLNKVEESDDFIFFGWKLCI